MAREMAYRHALITGGSSGIGRAIAKQLAQQGCNLSIIARNPSKLQTTQAELKALAVNAAQRIQIVSADLSDRSQTKAAIGLAITELGPPDLLITSAGHAQPGYFRELPLETFETTMGVNYFGTLYSIKAVLPAMQERGNGHIVLISSGAGLIGIFGYTPYSPSKFAVRGLAESLRGELKSMGLYVSIVYPPDTDTPQLAAENQTKPPETKRITATAQCLSAEQVAHEILKGIKRKQFVITPGIEMTLLARFHSLISPLLQWYFDRLATPSRTRF